MTREALSAEEVYRRTQAIGQYYGFRSFALLAAAKRGEKRKQFEMPTLPALDPAAESVSGFLKHLREADLLTPTTREPLFLWHTNIAPGRVAPKAATVQFHALGADRAIADAVLIRAVRALAHDLYKEEPEIRLNSMGDKETRARFARELGNFFKKRGNTLPEDCINCAKRDVLEAAELLIKQECADDLPSPTDHLSDASRKRFEELLEYLEATDTPFTLAPDLISRGNVWSETCFEVKIGDQVVAWGSRYPELAKMYYKTPLPATGAVLRIATLGGMVAPAPKSKVKPRFAFVHIGEEAKRVSIKLAEELKKARIPLEQMIGIESLTEQMRFAEILNPPYLLIMGRKEALEGSAVLRNRATYEETILPIIGLSERLRAVA
jgi:histidyl-tRNA synthetase